MNYYLFVTLITPKRFGRWYGMAVLNHALGKTPSSGKFSTAMQQIIHVVSRLFHVIVLYSHTGIIDVVRRIFQVIILYRHTGNSLQPYSNLRNEHARIRGTCDKWYKTTNEHCEGNQSPREVCPLKRKASKSLLDFGKRQGPHPAATHELPSLAGGRLLVHEKLPRHG